MTKNGKPKNEIPKQFNQFGRSYYTEFHSESFLERNHLSFNSDNK